MKYLSALFLVLLIAPIAYSQRDIIEMIEKTTEGKQVLDKIFLEVTLQGKTFNHQLVKKIVTSITQQTAAFKKDTINFLKSEHKICKTQLKQTAERFHDFTARAVYSRNTLSQLRRGQEVKSSVLKRGAYLYKMYNRFLSMSKEGEKQWSAFWANATKNYREISSLVSQVRAHVRRLHKDHNKVALIQLPRDYQDAMVEITTQFEQTYDDLNGLRPVISNLLEVVKSPDQLKNKGARASIRRILGHLAHYLHEQINLSTEENEHQKGIFQGLVGIFNTRVSSQSKVLKLVSEEAKRVADKINHVAHQAKADAEIASQAEHIVDLVRRECHGFKKEIRLVLLTAGRILNYSTQLEEVVVDRWPSLKSYFLEKLEEIEERA